MIPFKKNRNEAAYFDGKKHFIDVIKNTGDSSFLIWRQPEEDFNTHSKLIVMPGETAVFVDGGMLFRLLKRELTNSARIIIRLSAD